MYNPCIAIDVSMESSHYLGFYDFNQKVTSKPQIMNHTRSDMENLISLYNKLKLETSLDPTVVLEYTGIYHYTLCAFLKEHNIKYNLITPVKSSKHRQSKDNPVKTDSLDCFNLAEMFYEHNTGIYYERPQIYDDLRKLDAEYQSNKEMLQMLETSLNEKLAVIYPFYKNHFSDILSIPSLNFLEQFPHPSIFLEYDKNKFIDWYCEKFNHTIDYSTKKYIELLSYMKDICSCNKSDYFVQFLLNNVQQLKLVLSIQEEIKSEMIRLAKSDKNFELIFSIPGFGELTVARIIAGFGEISRFKSANKMVKYIGIDPIIYQSGKNNGKHYVISKSGNRRLRQVIFLAARSMIKKDSIDNPIKKFYYMKKAQPRIHPKVALVATMNKLTRTIYSMCKYEQSFDCSQL